MADLSQSAFAVVNEVGTVGMILYSGDLSSAELEKCVEMHLQMAIPSVGEIVERGESMIAWMSPDELLLMTSETKVASILAAFETDLADLHHLALDVSATRIVFEICGDGVRDVLAKGTPAVVTLESFRAGQMRRSRLGQVQAAFWMRDDATVRVVCRRSEAGYLRDWLHFATLDGSAPNYFSA